MTHIKYILAMFLILVGFGCTQSQNGNYVPRDLAYLTPTLPPSGSVGALKCQTSNVGGCFLF